MKIAIVYDAMYPYVAGGAERRYSEIGRRLVSHGHDVRFIGWRWWEGRALRRRDDGAWEYGVGTPPPLHDGAGRRTFREALAFGLRAAAALRTVDADVIECSSIPYVPALLAAPIAKARGIPLVVSWHEYMGRRWGAYAGNRAPIARLVERQAARAGDLRIAVSPFTARRLPRGPRTIVVPNGVDCVAFAAAERERIADVVVTGRLVPHKRIELVLQALTHAPGITAAIIGDGPERERLEAYAARLGIAERVCFTGRIEDDARVTAIVKGARCVVCASEQEGFGMSVLEAMAAGTPPIVVQARDSAATDLVAHGDTGYVVGADARVIAEAISQVCGDRNIRRRLSRHAAAKAAEYDWDTIAARMEDAFASLTGAARVPRPLREPRAVRIVEGEEQAA